MLFKADKYLYKRNIQVSIIISLLITILLFHFFPNLKDSKTTIIKIDSPIITVNDIPQTIQKEDEKISILPKPLSPQIVIPDDIVTVEILDDIKIKAEDKVNYMNEPVLSTIENKTNNIEITSFVPRQILEVVPGKSENNSKGIINLSLKIGKDGKVIEHRVLVNTTNSSECLKQVIAAAYNSRWEPVKIGGEKKEYWIEKTYRFNN